MICRAPIRIAEPLCRADLLRSQLLDLARTRRQSSARAKMRFWALLWRQEVRERGRSEASEGMLDLAVGWRSLDLKAEAL